MTDAPQSRKTHVTRLVGTNEAGDVLQNIWIDLERTDIEKFVTQTSDSLNYQAVQRKRRWGDDPNGDDYSPEGLPSETTEIVKVCSPNEPDLSNPQEWVPVRVRKRQKSSGGGQGTQDTYRNGIDEDPDPTTRDVEQRRISNYKTSIDDAAQAAFDADPTLAAYVVPGDQYTRDDSTKDESQYVETEVLKSVKNRFNAKSSDPFIISGDVNIGQQTSLKNQYLIDQSDPAQLTEVGDNGINPPYRLDPGQNIINVNFVTIYLLINVNIGNNSSSFGPYGDAPGIGIPSIASDSLVKSAKLLDDVTPSGIPINLSGFLDCLVYPSSDSPEAYWESTFESASFIGSIGGKSCAWPPGHVDDPTVALAPLNFTKETGNAHVYLYEVPANDEIVEINISGLAATFDSGPGGPRRIEINGAGTLDCYVYSTVHGKVSKIHQLLDMTGDGKPRPTPDDQCSAKKIDGEHQGRFKVGVKLDKDPAHAQTDNYGKTFQPYKVALDKAAQDTIPGQPPLRLTGPVIPP